MKIKQVVGLMTVALGVFIPHVECVRKSILFKNNTGNQLRIVATLDGEMMYALLDDKKSNAMPFERIDSLQIAPEASLFGFASGDYLDKIKPFLEQQDNLLISINPPQGGGLFSAVTSYINPYYLKNEIPSEMSQALLNSNIQEQFPKASEILADNPQAALGAAEALGIDPQSSLEKVMETIDDRMLLWKYAGLQAQTTKERALVNRAMLILTTLGDLAKFTLTSPIPKNWSAAKHKPKATLERNNEVNIARAKENLRLYLLGTDDEIEQKLQGKKAPAQEESSQSAQSYEDFNKELELLGIE